MKMSKPLGILLGVCVVYGFFAIIYHEYAKTAAGFDFFLYSGLVALALFVIICLVGFLGQGGKQ